LSASSTASGRVFADDDEGGTSRHSTPSTATPLWHYPTGSSIWGAASTTDMLDGRQPVLIFADNTLVAFARRPSLHHRDNSRDNLR
jgi:hypothetical protein